MATSSNISILITARDSASPAIRSVGTAIGDVDEKSAQAATTVNGFNQKFLALATASVAATGGLLSTVGALSDSIQAINRYDAAMAGLRTIATYFKQDQDAATKAAQALANDGLLSVTDAAKGLKNLLASGFNLEQSITLMERFKDSAAFNRQAALSFGDAISGATEGIKNGNSILVDNAGVTKNLSVILEEAGYSAQDLSKATSDVNIRTALYNGLLKETNPMIGDASKLLNTTAGKQALLAAETDKTSRALGQALQPALNQALKTIIPLVTAVGQWITANPQLASGIAIATALFLGLAAAIGAVGVAMLVFGPVVAVLGGPVTAAILAIGLLVSFVAGQIIANWEGVKNFTLEVWQGIQRGVLGVVGPIVAGLGGLWANIRSGAVGAANGVRSAFSWVPDFFRGMWSNITGIFGSVGTKIGNVMGNAFRGILKSVVGGAIGILNGFIDSINNVVDVINNIPNVNIGKIGRLGVPQFEKGTNFAPGGLALVGERGPELVNLPRGSKVYSAGTSQTMQGGSGASMVNHITINTQVDYRTLLSDIGWQLRTSGGV